MIKAYWIIKKTYICGELENTYKCNKVLYSDEEAKAYNGNHTYVYDTIEKIESWHKKEFRNLFCPRVGILRPFFGSKFLGLYSDNTKEYYRLKDYPTLDVIVEYSLEETTMSLEEVMKERNGEKAIQYLLERGITMLKELT